MRNSSKNENRFVQFSAWYYTTTIWLRRKLCLESFASDLRIQRAFYPSVKLRCFLFNGQYLCRALVMPRVWHLTVGKLREASGQWHCLRYMPVLGTCEVLWYTNGASRCLSTIWLDAMGLYKVQSLCQTSIRADHFHRDPNKTKVVQREEGVTALNKGRGKRISSDVIERTNRNIDKVIITGEKIGRGNLHQRLKPR